LTIRPFLNSLRASETGTTAVEFGIVVPVLIALLIGTFVTPISATACFP
jgi:Flp pilus assembly protein TadG